MPQLLKDFFQYVAGEWGLISQAPVSFALAVLVVSIAIWASRRTSYIDQIMTLKERIRLRDDQISHFQQGLDAADPADALVRLGELRERIESLSVGRWDALRADQRKRLRDALHFSLMQGRSRSPRAATSASAASGLGFGRAITSSPCAR